jgi:hypothetical protein
MPSEAFLCFLLRIFLAVGPYNSSVFVFLLSKKVGECVYVAFISQRNPFSDHVNDINEKGECIASPTSGKEDAQRYP